MKASISTHLFLGLCILSLVGVGSPVQAEVSILVNTVDPAGVGFNDPAPAAPVGGNPGITLGEQRRNVFQFAADVWGSILESPVEIVVQATFSPLPCTASAAVLGAAGTIQVFANFPSGGAEVHPDTWYHSALANTIAGFDLTPGPPDPALLSPPFNDDIVAFFNGDIDGNPDCLPGNWYYGFDNNASPGDVSLLNVVMHEFAHGLGLSNLISAATGDSPLDLPDVYAVLTFDTTTGKPWSEMTNVERLDSQVNTGNVVWGGPAVTHAAPDVLDFRAELTIHAPASLAGSYAARAAPFGPSLTLEGMSGLIELANDRVGDPADACESLKNRFKGKIALVRRGSCFFSVKAANAQAAGASAVIVINNVPGSPAPVGGVAPGIGIPVVGVSLADGDSMLATLHRVDVKVSLALNPDRLVGADDKGRVRLYAPASVAPGSSISHWDTVATPNLLMEPFLSHDLDAGNEVDLTRFQLEDLGWTLAEGEETAEASQIQ